VIGRDDELLDRLAAALAPPAVEPSLADVARLRLAVAGRLPRKSRWRWPLRITIPTVIIGFAGVGGSVGAAMGATLPAPLRSAAVAVGLPVDDNRVAAIRAQEAHLRAALARGDSQQVSTVATNLQSRLSGLGQDDRSEVEGDVRRLLDQASHVSAVGVKSSSPASPTGKPADKQGSGSEKPADPSHGGSGATKAGDTGGSSRHDTPPSTARGGGDSAGQVSDSGNVDKRDGGSSHDGHSSSVQPFPTISPATTTAPLDDHTGGDH
jgi:hypothetical protein